MGSLSGTHINHVGYKAGDNGKVRIGIVIGEFHDKLMNECLEDARLAAEQMDANITSVRPYGFRNLTIHT